jgi:hypothetical protein
MRWLSFRFPKRPSGSLAIDSMLHSLWFTVNRVPRARILKVEEIGRVQPRTARTRWIIPKADSPLLVCISGSKGVTADHR